MTKTIRIKLAIMSGVVALLTLSASQAQAALQVSYSLNSGASWTTLASGADDGPVPITFSSGGFSVSGSAGSNSPGNSQLSHVVSSVLDLSNQSGSTVSVWVSIVADDFTIPTIAPINLDSFISSNVDLASTGSSITYQSCVDPTNGTSNSNIACAAGSWVAGPGTINLSGLGSQISDKSSTITSNLGSSYAIGELFKIVLGNGFDGNGSATTSLTPVPEPMSIVMLGGVLLLTSRRFMRKRGQASQN